MSFADDPFRYVMFAFPWGKKGTILEGYPHPRRWQMEALVEMRDWLQSGGRHDGAFQFAVKSGHGPGKSAFISMVLLWAMSTMKDTKCVVTANTEGQLQKKTWPELSKWHKLSINAHWFKYTATSLQFVEKDVSDTWRADAIPWSETNPEAFAGLHNQGRRILVVFDEASAIHDRIWEVTEGALTDENTEIMWLVFGNPTRSDGRFRACFGANKHRWRRKTIDCRYVEGTNKGQIEKWIADHGVDSDFVRVRVRGEFPRSDGQQFISEGLAEEARKRNVSKGSYDFAPLIVGIDAAWTGQDPMEVVARQAFKSWLVGSIPFNDNDKHAAQTIAKWIDSLGGADAIFIDGGYGTGIYSILKEWGYSAHIVWFGSRDVVDPQWLNKRAEMWGALEQWLRDGGDIPDSDDWIGELCSPKEERDMNSGRRKLESKEKIRKDGRPNPGKGDALALTFAEPVISKTAMKALNEMDFDGEFDGIW